MGNGLRQLGTETDHVHHGEQEPLCADLEDACSLLEALAKALVARVKNEHGSNGRRTT